MNGDKTRKTGLLKVVLPAFFAGLFGMFTAMGTGYFTFANTDRALDLEMIRIGLSIVRGDFKEDGKGTALPARRFALRAIRQYSGVELADNELEDWASGGSTPFYVTEFQTPIHVDGYTPGFSSHAGLNSKTAYAISEHLNSRFEQARKLAIMFCTANPDEEQCKDRFFGRPKEDN